MPPACIPPPPLNNALQACLPGPGERIAPWRSMWAFADQGVVSLANFCVSILVARAAGEAELGLYGLGFMVFVLLMGLAKSLLWTPYTAILPRLNDREQQQYTANATAQFALLAVVSSLVLLAVGLALVALVPQREPLARLLTALSPCMAFLLLREHIRILCLAQLRLAELLAFDVVVCCVQLGGMLWLFRAGRLTSTTAFVVSAAAGSLSFGWILLRRAAFDWRPRTLGADWRRNWQIARWITPTAVMQQIGSQTPRWFLEAIYGLKEMGLFVSAQTVIQFANPLLLGNANYFGPSSASIYATHGKLELWRYTVRNTIFLGALIVGVVLTAMLLGPAFIQWSYGDSFQVSRELILALSVGMLLEVLLMPVDFAMLTLGRPSVSTAVTAARLALNLTLGLLMVYLWSARGIGYTLFLGNSIALAWMWDAFAREASPKRALHDVYVSQREMR
jgi:O-antigen/teichoic acid export membrane protein